ncbi:MAG: hypothetical protein AAF203_06830, partial [Pseudomonadota bacterium]
MFFRNFKGLLLVIVLIWRVEVLGAGGLDQFSSPSPIPIPGEMESIVSTKNFQFIGTNDYLGPTDKLLTGGATVSLGWVGKYYSLRLRTSLSLITPVFEFEYQGERPSAPIGEVADWLKIHLLQAITLPVNDWRFKIQLGIANNQVGDRGLDEVQEVIHRVIGNEFYLDQVEPSIEKDFISGDLLLGIERQFPSASLGLFVNLSYANDFFYPQWAAEMGWHWAPSENFGWLAKYSRIRPENKGFFQGLVKGDRKQALLAFQIYKHWLPAFGYSSVYLLDDQIDQWYLSALSFAFDF